MKAPVVEARRGCNACPVCHALGTVGASCDACLRRAYQAVIAVAQQGAWFASKHCTAARAKELHGDLLAGLSGVDVIREVLPGARFELPEVGR